MFRRVNIFISLSLLIGINSLAEATGNLGVSNHINLAKDSYNRRLNNAGHVHMLGGVATGAITTMDISSSMKKDFYLLGSLTTALGGAHYLSSAKTEEEYYEKSIESEEGNIARMAERKEQYYMALADQSKQSRIYSSASLMAAGAGYMAYYFKYKDDKSDDAHTASLAGLVIGVSKLIAGIGHLVHSSAAEKRAESLIKSLDKKKNKFSWDIGVMKDAPVLTFSTSF